MAKRIKITEQQLKILVEHIKSDRVDNPNKEVIEEGFKDVLLGAALLLNLNLSGQSAAEVKQMAKDKEALEQLTSVLQNDSMRSKVVDFYEKKGLKDVEEKIVKNNQKLIKALEKGKHYTSTQTVSTAAEIRGQLDQKRGLVSMKEITEPIVKVDSTIALEFLNDNSFITGSHELNDDVKNQIQKMVDELSSNPNVTVNSVKIVASTDTEPIRRYVTKSDPTGNVKLADLRIKSISDMLAGVVDSSKIQTKALPNSGPDVYTRTMSSEERDSTRKETQPHRYVTVELDITITPTNEQPAEPKYVCEFITVHTGGTISVNRKKTKIDVFTEPIKDGKLNIVPTECPLD